jgi:glucose-6-phosphate dehydrogenase assembly protein OpcA
MEGTLVQRTTRPSTPDSIDEDLRTLWRTVASEAPVARAVMANLLVFIPDGDSESAGIPLDEVVRRHPSRIVVLQHSRGDAAHCPPTDASISIVSFGPPHARYAVEQITLRAACGAASLPSIVRRFTRGDLPTSLWWTGDCSAVAPIPALARIARQLVFDSGCWQSVGHGIAAMAPLLHDPHAPQLSDINWRRLAAVRHAAVHVVRALPAGDPPLTVEIRHSRGEAALAWLLAGWLASRLGWADHAWPIAVQEVPDLDEVLALSIGAASVLMNAVRVAARSGDGRSLYHAEARRETTAEAVAAELATLAPDMCLKETLAALARQRL